MLFSFPFLYFEYNNTTIPTDYSYMPLALPQNPELISVWSIVYRLQFYFNGSGLVITFTAIFSYCLYYSLNNMIWAYLIFAKSN